MDKFLDEFDKIYKGDLFEILGGLFILSMIWLFPNVSSIVCVISLIVYAVYVYGGGWLVRYRIRRRKENLKFFREDRDF